MKIEEIRKQEKNIKKRDPKKEEERHRRDKEMVTGKFKFYEAPGSIVKFLYGLPYKGEPIIRYTIVDEEVCEVPRGLARHLMENCNYPVHAHKLDERGRPSRMIGKRVSRADFFPLNNDILYGA